MYKQSFRCCYFFKRRFKLKQTEPPKDIKDVFDLYSENGTMSINDLRRFLVEHQGEDEATVDKEAEAIFNSLKHLNVLQRRGLHLDAFFRYLFGDLNSPLPPPTVHHDMTAPLAHYFMYTGHNSYLTGNQLSSDSSIEPIVSALRRGVRVIELDLWPNPKRDDVVVCHGGTLTSSVELIKCLEAIKENAFYASEYPVIITFEDHLDPKLQAKVAQMVHQTFGDMLFLPKSEFLQELPGPEFTKKKILISTKLPKGSLDSTTAKESEQKQNEFDEDEDEEIATPEYKSLIAIPSEKLKHGVKALTTVDPHKVHRLALSELQLENAIKTHGTDIVRFTQQNLLRVYPKGTRISSSNYNPVEGWTYGIQMAAVNMQGYDKHLWITHGRFRANGGCGYVKKPDFLLNVGPNNEVFDPRSWHPVKTTLKVKIYMGDGWQLDFKPTYFDPFSPPDFFAKVQILGVSADKEKMKTMAIEDQWVPVWNEEFVFPLTVVELALLRIEVREFDTDGRHDFGGQTCLPVSELRTGIRAVPLYDRKGEKYRSVKLLMRFVFV
ncbi:hypothetical protein Nepgr_014554 [Nepenthes gracilis]|uniref:Phosphoinositide phospholipase C n=1 Tax=Nepenthes gracilis TaxID=150966 RepID=A0AAD3SK80_NEPGR|nr:hypothetical protein Nepgr_014554 [Nepenthes gracilis]